MIGKRAQSTLQWASRALVILVLAVSCLGQAKTKVQGWCQQGGNTVSTAGLSSTTKVQQSFPSCTVTIYDAGTLNLSVIYSDAGGTPKANPFTADSTGYWFFYGPAGTKYDVRFSGGGIGSPFTLGDHIAPGAPQVSHWVNVKDYGAVGDGVANDNTAFQNAIVALGTVGGTLYIPQGRYAGLSTLTFNVPVWIMGAGMGNYYPDRVPAILEFVAGQTGIVLADNSQGSRISGVYLHSNSVASGSDDGVRIFSSLAYLEHVVARNFGRRGFSIDTSVSGNANHAVIISGRAQENRSHGFYLIGTNSNAITIIGSDATSNGGYGFHNSGAHNTFINTHTDANTGGAYYDNGATSFWLRPYAEANGAFLIDTGSSHGVIEAGVYALPTITNNAIGGGSWRIWKDGEYVSLVVNKTFTFKPSPGAGYIAIQGPLGSGIDMPNAGILYGRTTGGALEACLYPRWTANETIFDYGTGGLLIRNQSGSQAMSFAATLEATFNKSVTLGGYTFAALPSPANGTILYCSDCTANSNPCTGSGTGAIAKRLNSAWDCR